jgi:hypothetical protein
MVMTKLKELKNNTLIQRILRMDPSKDIDHKFIKELIEEEGAEINYIWPKNGYSAFSAAASVNNLDLVKYFISKGVASETINHPSKDGTPLWFAVNNNNPEMLNLLFDTGFINIDSINNAPANKPTPIETALHNNNNKILADLIINFLTLSYNNELLKQQQHQAIRANQTAGSQEKALEKTTVSSSKAEQDSNTPIEKPDSDLIGETPTMS